MGDDKSMAKRVAARFRWTDEPAISKTGKPPYRLIKVPAARRSRLLPTNWAILAGDGGFVGFVMVESRPAIYGGAALWETLSLDQRQYPAPAMPSRKELEDFLAKPSADTIQKFVKGLP